MRAVAATLAGVLAAGCAATLQTVREPALEQKPPVIDRLAVAPFGASSAVAAKPEERAALAALVGGFVVESLAVRPVRVTPPSDVEDALAATQIAAASKEPKKLARLVADRFHAQAVLTGELRRFRKRGGRAEGTTQPASVAFEVTLYAAPSGKPLWSAVFDETQQPLLWNVFNVFRYPGGGTRWLTGDELARWGAGEVAKALPLGH